MELLQAIQKRRSYRGMYRPDPVPREDLQLIAQAALAAPSGCNAQTTSVLVLDDPQTVKQIGGMMHKPSFASAPAAMLVLTERKIAYADRTFYVQDYAAAIENALLAITALGYESCWVEGYVTGQDQVGRKMGDALGVPPNLEVVAYLPIGRAAEEGGRVEKLPFEERAWFNHYGK